MNFLLHFGQAYTVDPPPLFPLLCERPGPRWEVIKPNVLTFSAAACESLMELHVGRGVRADACVCDECVCCTHTYPLTHTLTQTHTHTHATQTLRMTHTRNNQREAGRQGVFLKRTPWHYSVSRSQPSLLPVACGSRWLPSAVVCLFISEWN